MAVATLDYLRNLYVEEKELPPLEPVPISICTPLYNSMPFLRRFLTHILLYDWPSDITSLYFTVQGDDGTLDAMKTFRDTYSDAYKRIKVKHIKQSKGGELPHVRNVVQCRNLLAKWSRPDLVFFNDHDNFNPPVSIRRLYDGLRLGADGAAGVYFFSQWDEKTKRQRAGFTSFFLHNGEMRGLALKGMSGAFPLELFSRRLWMDAIACGCLLVKREVLDKQRFFMPYDTTMTDDVAFCLKAREKGFRFIADFNLIVPHWGFNVTHQKFLMLTVERTTDMLDRRSQMERDGVYVQHETGTNINEAVKRLIDIDKVEAQRPQNR